MAETNLTFKFFLYFYKISSYIGIVPFYSFKNKKISGSKKKIVTSLCVVFHGILFSASVYLEIAPALNESNNLTNVMCVLTVLIFFQMPIISITYSYAISQKWEHCLTAFMNMEEKFVKNQQENNNNYFFFILICSGLQLLLNLKEFSGIEIENLNYLDIIKRSIAFIVGINWSLLNCLCIVMFSLLRRVYKLLKIKLRRVIVEAYVGKFICDENKILQQIKIIKKIHMNLFEEITFFNVLFGWYILSVMIHLLVSSITSFTFYVIQLDGGIYFVLLITEVRFGILLMFILVNRILIYK